jgi:hypothetical protein
MRNRVSPKVAEAAGRPAKAAVTGARAAADVRAVHRAIADASLARLGGERLKVRGAPESAILIPFDF